jgi:hypothetical protein
MADDTSEETSTEPLLKLMPPRLNFPRSFHSFFVVLQSHLSDPFCASTPLAPYTKIVQSILTIQNTSDKIVAYKVREHPTASSDLAGCDSPTFG